VNTHFWDLVFRWSSAAKSLGLEIFGRRPPSEPVSTSSVTKKEEGQQQQKPLSQEDALIHALFEHISKTFPRVHDLEDEDQLSKLPIYSRMQQETLICTILIEKLTGEGTEYGKVNMSKG